MRKLAIANFEDIIVLFTIKEIIDCKSQYKNVEKVENINVGFM